MNDIKIYELQKTEYLKMPYMPISKRKELLTKLYDLVKNNEKKIMDALYLDLNKSPNEAYFAEIGLVLKSIKYNLKHLAKWAKPKRVKTPITLFSGTSKIIYEPLGLTLIISPWNYPFYLSLSPLIAAIAAGNRAIIKPSEFSRHTTNVLIELINNTFDPKYVYVIEPSIENITKLLEHRFDLIFFTGSERVGTIISEKASKYHTPVILELGGKSPTVIFDDIDLKFAAKKILFGKLVNAGQTCVAPDYVCVPKNKANEFIKYANEIVEEWLTKRPENNKEYPKIITSEHHERLNQYLPKDLQNRCINQKIVPYIYRTDWQDPIMKHEIFGPILPVIEYKNINEVYDFIKHFGKPLASYVFSKNNDYINDFSKHISAGSLVINETLSQLSSDYLPFGGVGSSGTGRYHGFEGFKTFSNAKAFYKKGKLGFNLAYHPYNEKKLNILKKLVK